MKPRDKAIELVDKAMSTIIVKIKQNIKVDTIQAAKSLSVNTVDEMLILINKLRLYIHYDYELNYWNNVKKEIEKL
jgi:hypothetical protein